MKNIKQDRIFGIIIILFACFLFFMISTITPMRAVDPNDAGPKFFPRLIAIGITICGAGMLLLPERDQTKFLEAHHWKKIAAYFGLLAGYLILMYLAGFLLATPIGLFLFIYMLAEDRKKLKWAFVAAYSVAFPILLYFSFTVLLKIMLPRGILFR